MENETTNNTDQPNEINMVLAAGTPETETKRFHFTDKEIEEIIDTLDNLVNDVSVLLNDYDIEFQSGGYYNHAKSLLKRISND